jgi:hypothetical protein
LIWLSENALWITVAIIFFSVVFQFFAIIHTLERIDSQVDADNSIYLKDFEQEIAELKELVEECSENTEVLRNEVNYLRRLIDVGITKGLIQEMVRLELEVDKEILREEKKP